MTCTSEPCTAVLRATIAVPRIGRTPAKTFKVKAVTVKLAKGAKRKVVLRLAAPTRLAIARPLRLHRPVAAKLTATVKDAAGNARTLRRTVRFAR